MGVKIQLFEVGVYRSDFCLWGWMKSEIYKEKVNTRDELVVRVMNNAALINPLTPNDPYSGRTAPLTSKCCILYIYSTNTSTEYFKHTIYSPFFSLQNTVCFIILTYLVPVLFIFCIQAVLKFKKIIPAPKG